MDNCIEFEGYKNLEGYGRTTYKGEGTGAHRKAYCVHHNLDLEDIKGKVVMHICDNPACINPDHLLLGTQVNNIRDRCEKGRTARNYGNKNQAKLNASEVVEIRKRYKPRDKVNGGSALASEFGVSCGIISMIVNNLAWRDI